MSRNPVLLLAAILVGIGLAVWLLAGGLTPDGGEAVSRDPASDGTASPLESGHRGAGGESGAPADGGARLFGRPAVERIGRGSVHGRVLTAATNEPVAGAKVLLAGEGFGGEAVAWRGETGAEGEFRVPEVPAGDDYDLILEAQGHPGRTLPAVSVRDGSATALGTIWLGAQVALVGRVMDESGRGIPGAVVSAHAGHFSLMDMFGNLTELFSSLDREPEALAQTTTDGRGAFAFEALDPGPITVTVRAAGFEPQHREVVAAERVDETPIVLRMLAGQRIAGRVVDASGMGLAGARIAAVSGDNPLAFLYGRSFTQTDADGTFRVDAAASTDEVMLLASAPGYAVTTYKTAPGSTDVKIVLDRSATLVVRVLQAPGGEPLEGASVLLGVEASGEPQGDPTCILSGFTDATGRIVSDVPPGKLKMVMVSSADGRFGMWQGANQGFQNPMQMEGPEDASVSAGRQEMVFRVQDSVILEGTVRDEAGTPVVGARVFGSAGLQLAKAMYTDEGGRYRVRQSRGLAILFVRADGFLPHQEMVSDLPESGTKEHDLTLTRAAIVTGRVLEASGSPLPGVRVRAKTGRGTAGFLPTGLLGEPEGLTDGQGRYAIDGVSPAEAVRVMARHTATADAVSEPFEVGKGGSVRAPDLVLRPGTDIDVLVRDPDGRPLGGARVELSFDRGAFPDWDTLDMFSNDANVVTNAQGHVGQDRIPACEVTVTATHPDYAQGKTVRTIAPEAVSPVRIEVSVTVPVTVAGQVLDAGGRPLEKAWVTVQPEGETVAFERALTDAEGRFVIAGVAEGPFTLRANKPGFRPFEEAVDAAREDLLITLEAYDAATAARRAELTQRIQDLSERIGSAANDREREALSAEIQAAAAELRELNEAMASDDR